MASAAKENPTTLEWLDYSNGLNETYKCSAEGERGAYKIFATYHIQFTPKDGKAEQLGGSFNTIRRAQQIAEADNAEGDEAEQAL